MMRLPDFSPVDSMPGKGGVVTRYDVIVEARTWIDTPFMHQHRMKGHGVDCVGLVIGVCRALGLVAPGFDINGYARKPVGNTLIARCSEYMDPIDDRDAKPGNVLLLAYRRDPQHLGILADYQHGGFSLIHAYGAPGSGGRVEEWNLAVDRRAFQPIQAFALRGVA